MENNRKKEVNGKTGLIPDEEIKGSDADKAYDEEGNFEKPDASEKVTKKDNVPPGADADS